MDWHNERSRTGGIDEVPLPSPAGRLFLAGKHFVGPDPEAALARVEACAIVCLNERHELELRYPGYVTWLRANAGHRALWHPVPDLHAPSPEDARTMLDDLHGRLADGNTLLVHCGAGIGRAGTIAVGLLLRFGLDLEDALDTVAASRPGAGPEAGAQQSLLQTLAGD